MNVITILFYFVHIICGRFIHGAIVVELEKRFFVVVAKRHSEFVAFRNKK